MVNFFTTCSASTPEHHKPYLRHRMRSGYKAKKW